MKKLTDKLRTILAKRKQDREYKVTLSAALSLCITCVFAFYNGFLGITSGSRWHGGICGFYLCLAFLRAMVLLRRKARVKNSLTAKALPGNYPGDIPLSSGRIPLPPKSVFWVMWGALFVVDISLILPISMMVLMEKPVKIGLIAAIAMAAYTFFKLGVLCFNTALYRRKGRNDIFISVLRTINFIETAVSVLSLQNTLIMVNSTKTSPKEMIILSEIVGAAVYAVILYATVRLPKKYKSFDGSPSKS